MLFEQLAPERDEQPIVQTVPTTPHFNNSIFFDLRYFNKPSKKADYIYDLFLSELTDIPNNRVTRKHLRCLAYNLNRLLVKRPEGVLVCPKQSVYWNKLGRAVNPYGITKTLADLAKKLEKLGYVEFKRGSFFDDGSAYSRIWPTDKFKALLNDSGLEDDLIVYTKHDDFVFFRPPSPTKYKKVKRRDGSYKKIKLKLPKQVATGTRAKKMSAILRDYNNLLERTDVYIPASKNNGEKIAPDSALYRSFNNSELTLGGRYYGGAWEIENADLRKEFLINGNPTVELDYKAQHLYMLYALVAGKHYDEIHDDGDPYIIKNKEGQKYDRDACKILLLTALNAKDTDETWLAIKDKLKKDKKKYKKRARKTGDWSKYLKTTEQQEFFKTKDNYETLLEDCFIKHDLIKGKLCSGIGIKLQYIDSQITEHAIKTLTKEEILVLPVHDSNIVEEQHKERLREVMKEAYTEINLPEALPPIR